MSAFDDIKKALEDYDLADIAECAECHPNTLQNWIDGKYLPRFATLVSVADAIGYSIEIRAVQRK